jgi:hypothetical protein
MGAAMTVFHPSRKIVIDTRQALLTAGLWVLPMSTTDAAGAPETARRRTVTD